MTPRFPIQTGTEIDRLRAQIGPDSHITGVVMLPEDVIHTARQIIAGVTQ